MDQKVIRIILIKIIIIITIVIITPQLLDII